jgi:hypothetical protein
MTVSVLLRLAGEALERGRLAGEAEVVDTGRRAVVRDAGELVEFLRRHAEEPEGGAEGSAAERAQMRSRLSRDERSGRG